jgi:hypothetical protein
VSRAAREALVLYDLPRLRKPVVICSFEGWNDAASAASTATDFLRKAWSATPFAEIDPEEFIDFTDARPEVRLVDGETRVIVWPRTVLSWASPPGLPFDVVLVRGFEPQLRWRTYSTLLVNLLSKLGADRVVTAGALLAEIAHSRPVPVVASTTDAELLKRAGLSRSRYEGPTGIVGVMHASLGEAGIPAASVWASIPYYVPQITSAKAALALVKATENVIGFKVDKRDLERSASNYEKEVDELVAEDDDVAAYVARLEEIGASEAAEEAPLPDIAAEAEKFLRDQRHR